LSDIGELRQALATALGSIQGLQVSPYVLAAPTLPCAYIFADEIEFDYTMGRGTDHLGFVVRVAVPLGNDIGDQVNLDAYRAGSGSRSIKAAIESDSTLGGALRVTGVSRDTVYVTEGQPPALGCEFRIELYATGT
jgi:hypothetical protein